MIIWKPVVGYEGLYEVSNTGKIRSVEREYFSGGFGHRQVLPQKLMVFKIDKDGYYYLGLRKDKIRSFKRVGRIVCEAFHPNTDNKPVVNHKNGDNTCDCEWNLEWTTQSENILHSYRVLKRKPNPNMKGRIGFLSPFSKPLYQMDNDGKLIKVWGSIGEAVLSGFSRTRLKEVVNGNKTHHKGFKWSR